LSSSSVPLCFDGILNRSPFFRYFSAWMMMIVQLVDHKKNDGSTSAGVDLYTSILPKHRGQFSKFLSHVQGVPELMGHFP
jgi:hypothetical protein